MNLDEAIYHSRHTLLDILDKRGYNVTPFRKFGPEEAKACAESFPENYPALDFTVTHKEDQAKKIAVFYPGTRLNQTLRVNNFLTTVFNNITDSTEVICMLTDPTTEELHSAVAYKQWVLNKRRVSFFWINHLVINPTEHVFVPRHEKVPDAEVADLLKTLRAKASQLPLIRFHTDMQARCLGLIPGDIVKITRPSPSAGEYIVYRVCSP